MTDVSVLVRLLNVTPAAILRKLHVLPKPRVDPNLLQIPAVPLSEALKGRPTIRVDGLYSYVDGSLPWADIIALLSIAVDRHPQTVVEIGTLHGHTTRLLAINLPMSQIHTIDLPLDFTPASGEQEKDDLHLIRNRRVGEEYRSDPSVTNVIQHLGDTARLPFPEGELYYIDGAHTYEYVRNDSEKALNISKVKTIIWHDCDEAHPAVTRRLHEMTIEGFPVRRIANTHLAVLDRD